MIKVKSFASGVMSKFKMPEIELESFLNEIGEENIIQILPRSIAQSGPSGGAYGFTVIYRSNDEGSR